MPKNEIRPIYHELQGYLSQAPEAKSNIVFGDKPVWEIYNNTIDELNTLTENNYDKFKVHPDPEYTEGEYVKIIDYRTKLSGLISKLYGQFFSDEISPFSGVPGTSIQMNQQQNQNVQTQILLETQSIIDKKISEVIEPNEKSFLKQIKNSLSSVKNISELINLILYTGSSFGMNIEQILKLFK